MISIANIPSIMLNLVIFTIESNPQDISLTSYSNHFQFLSNLGISFPWTLLQSFPLLMAFLSLFLQLIVLPKWVISFLCLLRF